ncbi:phosphatase PAP2 family protein [Aurantiacibacter luteus]|uniref:phosphatase PAP2 family protein n=1 Tax=Aurantiacibacter luteus TaxID=1581420 RepID=UPI00069C5B06|nr:phosphatase PAP2 family protein [Aurantiacibacter luteus]
MDGRQSNLDDAAVGEGLIASLDLTVVGALEPYCDHPAIKAVGKASELADQPPLIAASLATVAAGLLARRPRLARTGVRMLASHLLATGIKTLLKDNIDRPRPKKVEREGEHAVEPGKSKDGEERSFPSGHSAGATAVARSVVREYPGGAGAAYALAATASAIQVPRKAHFPSDVVVGVVIGLVSEALVELVLRRR